MSDPVPAHRALLDAVPHIVACPVGPRRVLALHARPPVAACPPL